MPAARRGHRQRLRGRRLLLERTRVRRRLVLVGVLLIDLGALGAFKYFGFFADSFSPPSQAASASTPTG